eukprot:TRINITY_DN3198_c1_g1_i4.p1 TRINITY_DN3198_c1_g1~~TRINITY_DN3198_c1_g1_i4.p1  ORF type:complete len:541 (+),score=99.77 TRINITY_DN3198_c1_g1_i4:114-1736(+)
MSQGNAALWSAQDVAKWIDVDGSWTGSVFSKAGIDGVRVLSLTQADLMPILEDARDCKDFLEDTYPILKSAVLNLVPKGHAAAPAPPAASKAPAQSSLAALLAGKRAAMDPPVASTPVPTPAPVAAPRAAPAPVVAKPVAAGVPYKIPEGGAKLNMLQFQADVDEVVPEWAASRRITSVKDDPHYQGYGVRFNYGDSGAAVTLRGGKRAPAGDLINNYDGPSGKEDKLFYVAAKHMMSLHSWGKELKDIPHSLPKSVWPKAVVQRFFQICMWYEDWEGARKWLAHGADPKPYILDIESKERKNSSLPDGVEGMTSTHYAVGNASIEMCKLLQEIGAWDVATKGNSGRTPILTVCSNRVGKTPARLTCLQMLLNTPGIQVNVTAGGTSAMHDLLSYQKYEADMATLAKPLLEAGYDLSIKDKTGTTCLEYAIRKRYTTLTQLFESYAPAVSASISLAPKVPAGPPPPPGAPKAPAITPAPAPAPASAPVVASSSSSATAGSLRDQQFELLKQMVLIMAEDVSVNRRGDLNILLHQFRKLEQ